MKPPARFPLVPLLCVPLVLAAACGTAATERPAAATAEPAATTSGPAAGDLAGALARVLDGEPLPSPTRVEVECLTGDGFYETRLYGTGVGVWQGRAELELPPEELRSLLELFRRYRFAELEESYGGKSDPRTPATERPADRSAIRIVCAVALTLGDASKRVTQLDGGRQSAELRRLAEELIERVAERGGAGRSAESLADGLEQVAAGELAPETLDLLFHLKRAGGGGILRVRHGRIAVRPYGPDGALGDPVERPLGGDTARDLADGLRAARVDELPLNLFSDDYVDLRVGVLEHERALQARGFAAMDAETHGRAQQDFDRLVEELERLAVGVTAD